ncbi:MAG: exo-alpha-sialidase [Paracoccaceae bacterium]
MADLLIGTTKGLFIIENRDGWQVSGPFCDGAGINHAIGTPEGEIWAGGGNSWVGVGVWHRKNGAWSAATGQFDVADSIWSLARNKDRLLAGTRPATLWESRDDGATWAKLPALTNLEGAENWDPGAAGLVLHSILMGPENQLWVGISSAGVFASPDGGETWEQQGRRSNRPGPAGNLERHWDGVEIRGESEIFKCVHNLAFGASPGLIYMQNHQGVYRSRDGGAVWEEITEGLPSTFGFPVGAHPRDPGTLWVFPLNGDSAGRFPPDARALIWKSTDGGETWQPKGQGLPAKDCFFTVLRQAMAVDRATPCGVYFGTNTGSVFASRDEGETWEEIARHLPTVLSVEVMQ